MGHISEGAGFSCGEEVSGLLTQFAVVRRKTKQDQWWRKKKLNARLCFDIEMLQNEVEKLLRILLPLLKLSLAHL